MNHRTVPATLAAALLLAACGADASDGSDEPAAAASTDLDGFPVTVDSCEQDVTIEAPPERILVLGRAELVAILAELDETERIVGRAGAFPTEYFDDATNAAIADVPSLSDDVDESGHLQISQESILELDPDLVLGVPDGIDEAGLRDAGIPVIEQPANCPAGLDDVGFEAIYDQVELYGEVLGVPDRAEEVVAELEERVAQVEAAAADVGDGRVAAALYPTVGGGTTYAYGNRSFPHVLLETAGFDNAFADTDERVFEVAGEELLDRDPQALVLLHVDGEPGPVADAVGQLPGVSGLAAVEQDQLLVQLFNFGEYPSPLVIDGLEQLVAAFGDGA